ncbi:MAG: hypothetical protein M1822_005900 [Bathelium mastoideum]|nr:MAG: hypothetical protein M1822_005900 [Bathelium mastoideum]
MSLQNEEYLVTGYPKLGQKMGVVPEQAIFRRFSALNAEILLHQQAELVYLEKELREIQRADNHDRETPRGKYAVNWYWLRESNVDENGTQWKLLLKIRARLREYNEALVLQSKVARLPEPGSFDLKAIQNYLANPEMGPLALFGEDATVWGSASDSTDHSPDLIALVHRRSEDIFSKWFTEKAIVQFFRFGLHRVGKPKAIHGLPSLHDSTLFGVTYLITSIIASLLPMASISILYFVQSMRARLAIIAAFNIIVALSLTAFTTAKRSDVFAVVAAFSAIQAVFVGNNNANCNCAQ